jgi:hypothetical protein
MRQKRTVLLLMVLVCCSAGVRELHADPLVFRNAEFSLDTLGGRLDLFSNPGAILTAGLTGPEVKLGFLAEVPHLGGESFTDVIRFTYHETRAGTAVQAFQFTTGTDPMVLGFLAVFDPMNRTGKPVPATLTIDLLNSSPDFVIPSGPHQGRLVDSYTYSFFTLAPVPEPSSLVLLCTGVFGALAMRRRRRFR